MLDQISNLTAESVFQTLSITAAVTSVLLAGIAAIRSGAIKSVRFGSISIEGAISETEIESLETVGDNAAKPFEIKALANYYNQALGRANISFWFSLVFASIGFGVIIFALFSHNPEDSFGTIIKVMSGTVIDAVSALFFAQSTSAQKSMSEFFEKLRLDRLNAEARDMIAEIEDAERRDQLRAQLILKYSGIDKLLEGARNV